MDKTNAAPQGESNRVKDEPASTDEAQSLGAGNTHTCELPPAGAAPLTREEIEWIRDHLTIDPCEIGCYTPEVPICVCERRINNVCDMALRSLDAQKDQSAERKSGGK